MKPQVQTTSAVRDGILQAVAILFGLAVFGLIAFAVLKYIATPGA